MTRDVSGIQYPPGLVQVIAARLHEAKIWENEEVRCESWFDSEIGGKAFLLDVMVAQGLLIRMWSKERGQFAYCASDTRGTSHFVI